LVQVITAPDQLTARKDPTLLELSKKFGMEMPNLGVGRDDALKIVATCKVAPPRHRRRRVEAHPRTPQCHRQR
jgi:hypothetical protein